MKDELLELFAIETGEILEEAALDVAGLEASPDDPQLLERLFRAVHTLKGSAGLVGFAPMGELFHLAEDRLSEVRSGARGLDADLLRGVADALGLADGWRRFIADRGELPASAAAQTAGPAARLANAAEPAPPRPAPAMAGTPDWALPLLEGVDRARAWTAIRYTPRPDSYFAGVDPLAVIGAAPGVRRLAAAPREPFGDLAAYDPFSCNLVLTALSEAPLGEVQPAFRLLPGEAELAEVPPVRGAGETGTASRTVRVESERLDALASAVEELVISKNSLAHLAAQVAALGDARLARSLADLQIDLDRRVSRLHDTVTRLRLVPLAPLFRRFPRLVRETAEELGKAVDLTLSGEDVEVDKTVVDALFEPLLHLARNAVGHGAETAEERRAAGKPERVSLRLGARVEGDQVLIELADDGRGVDPSRVRSAALARGVMDEARLAALSDEEAIQLIFAPGFSTAGRVTELSGRGVGLDAVRAAALALGGRVAVESAPGAGARFVLALPLRVRLAKLMVVEAAGEAFGVPLEALIETARVEAGQVTPVRAGRALVWRDRPLALLDLADLLRLPARPAPGAELKLMIVQAGEEPAAVCVDAFGERIEAPLKPMTRLLSHIPGVAGTTLLGDGRVLMVLDLEALIG